MTQSAASAGPVVELSPKIRSRQNRTRQRILRESARLFVERGFENVSVEDIIAASEIARSSFYRFFDNREAVLSQIVQPVFEHGARLLARRPEPEPAKALDHIVQTYLQLWRDSADALRVSARVRGVNFSLFREGHNGYRQKLMHLLERAEKAGLLRNQDADLSGRLIARTAIPMLEIYAGRADLEEIFTNSMRGLLLATEETP